MKNSYLFAIIFIAFTSCSKDDVPNENIQSKNENIEILSFSSFGKMDDKIDEISMMKMEMEKHTAQKYTSKHYPLNKSNDENVILSDLKKYHADRLNDIYEIRKDLNFVSIQSIADEINSLKILDSNKYGELLKKYEPFLKQTKYGVVTVFENGTSDIINTEGEVLINGKSVDFKIPVSKSETGKYVGDESIKEGQAALSRDWKFMIIYRAGREKHKDDFGRTFFKYFTEFTANYMHPTYGPILCPTTFSVTNSIAGFSQSGSGSNPFAEFAFSMQYPSGYGSSIRNRSGQKWTAYQTEGGNIKGTFIGNGYTLNCDFK